MNNYKTAQPITYNYDFSLDNGAFGPKEQQDNNCLYVGF